MKRFTRSRRLVHADQFVHVLRSGGRGAAGPYYWRCCVNSLPHPRLGIVVARRWCKRAVARNYIKRRIRESFRCHQGELPSIDIVIGLRRPIDDVRAIDHRAQLDVLWRRLQATLSQTTS